MIRLWTYLDRAISGVSAYMYILTNNHYYKDTVKCVEYVIVVQNLAFPASRPFYASFDVSLNHFSW
jgi:hypothetical protein